MAGQSGKIFKNISNELDMKLNAVSKTHTNLEFFKIDVG